MTKAANYTITNSLQRSIESQEIIMIKVTYFNVKSYEIACKNAGLF